ncbi:MAG: hypothetical protein H0W82_05130, partial [Actinobacteria bacterium]|nr:hypothetical protein [Actinomycetota bacterium]
MFAGDHAVPRLIGVALISAIAAALLERRNLVLATLLSAVGLLVVLS